MNFNKDLYETSEAKEFGEFENLELGGHAVVIMDAREYVSEVTGNTSLKISIDIADTDKQAGFFKKQFDNSTMDQKKWPSGAVRYLSLKDENIAYLKGFITALENSNSKFKFNKNGEWDQLKGLKCAGVFGWEEYTDNEGKVKTTTKLTNFRSLDKLKEIKIPKVKTIDNQFIDYDDYQEYYMNKSSNNNEVAITGDDWPF